MPSFLWEHEHLVLPMLAALSSAVAQPALRVGSDTQLVGSGAVRVVNGGGTAVPSACPRGSSYRTVASDGVASANAE